MLALLLCLLQAELPRLGGFLKETRDLAEPTAVCFDPAGELWIAQAHAGQIRGPQPITGLVEPRGLTRADDGTWYIADGTRILAQQGAQQRVFVEDLGEPAGLAWAKDRLYVADASAHCVWIFDSRSGALLQRLGQRGSQAGEFLGPRDVALAASGELFVADTGNHRIQRFDAEFQFQAQWGAYGPYPGLYSSPSGIEWHAERLYVADTGNHRIQVSDAQGQTLYAFGVHSIRPRDGQGRLHYPTQLALTADGKNIAIAEGFEDRVQVFGPETAESRRLQLQNELSNSAHYSGALAVGGRLALVLEPETANAVVLDIQGREALEISRVGRFGDKPDLFARPIAVALDPSREWAAFADRYRARLSVFALSRPADAPVRYDLMLPRLVAALDTSAFGFEPKSLARSGDGRWWVLAHDGSVWQAAADLDGLRCVLPVDEQPSLAAATSLAVDEQGMRLAFALPSAHQIRWCTWPQVAFHELPLRADTGLAPRPSALCFTPQGTLLVTDEARHELREIDLEGQERLRLGQAGLGRGQFHKPRGVALDERNTIWVLDAGNHRIQVFDRQGRYLQASGSRLFTDPLRKGFEAATPAEWESWPSVTSAQARYRIHYRASISPLPQGENVSVEAHLVRLRASSAALDLRLDGAMPEHGHGLARDTRAIQLGPDHFRFEGLRLHMSGRWRLYFDVLEGARTERAEWELTLE